MAGRGWILAEGYTFIAPPLSVGLLGFVAGWLALGSVGLLISLGVAFFFRNPTRRPPRVPGAVLSPADGRIVEVAEVEHPEEGCPRALKISIFMSVFNVHVNRSPVQGEVVAIRHEPGAFRPAYRGETSSSNERHILSIRTKEGRLVTCVQVAGVLARRIVCWIREGASVGLGEPFGMIRFGSRVDCYFPPDFDPDVRLGQRVRGGETILGYFDEHANA